MVVGPCSIDGAMASRRSESAPQPGCPRKPRHRSVDADAPSRQAALDDHVVRTIEGVSQAGVESRGAASTMVGDQSVATLDVTEVTQSLKEGLSQVGASARVERQVAYSRDLGRLLASAASGASARPTARMTASPISRMGTSGGDDCRRV